MVILVFSALLFPIWTIVPGGNPAFFDLFLTSLGILIHLASINIDTMFNNL